MQKKNIVLDFWIEMMFFNQSALLAGQRCQMEMYW